MVVIEKPEGEENSPEIASVLSKADVRSGDVPRGIDPVEAAATAARIFASFNATVPYEIVNGFRYLPQEIQADAREQDAEGDAEKVVEEVFHKGTIYLVRKIIAALPILNRPFFMNCSVTMVFEKYSAKISFRGSTRFLAGCR